MVKLNSAVATNLTLARSQPLVAVFSGATQGIGEYTLRTLVKAHGPDGPGLRVYLIGRRQEPADKLFEEFRQVCPSADFKFVKAADLTLLGDVDKACKEVLRRETEDPFLGGPPRVDLLFMTQGYVRFGDPEYTSEGLEVSMSLLYYSRMRLITNLIPLLTASTLSAAHIISIYAGKAAAKTFFPDDLSLTKDPKNHYTFMTNQTHCCYMKTLYFEHLAKQHPGRLSFLHVYPGVVVTAPYGSSSNPWWFKTMWFLLGPLIRLFVAITPEEIGERMLYLAGPRWPGRGGAEKDKQVAMSTDGSPGRGAYCCNYDGETYEPESVLSKQWREKGLEAKVVEHMSAVFAAIDAGQRFVEK